jgi:hypothetical protein
MILNDPKLCKVLYSFRLSVKHKINSLTNNYIILINKKIYPVLRIRIRDSRSGSFLTPGSGSGSRDGKKVRIRDPDI